MNNNVFIKYASEFQTKIDQTLSRIASLLDLLNNPQDSLKFIHVAGTNGKGSVCSFLQSILSCSGHKTGKFISPYMHKTTDSISIDGLDIENNEFENILSEINEIIKKNCIELPSQFEIQVSAAFLYFYRNNVDFVVLETGLGGSLDATNIIKSPILSVITKIDIDHKAFLGDTIFEIAKHKAGIIKKNGATITTLQTDEVLLVIEPECAEKNNKLMQIKKADIKAPIGIYECFSYGKIKDIICGLPGYFQIENACIAIECSLFLGISEEIIRIGIKNAKNPARFEILRENPTIIFDGAHNLNGSIALKESLDRYYKNIKKNYIMAYMSDKETEKILGILNDGKNYYFTEVKNNDRSMRKEELLEIARAAGLNGITCDIEAAVKASLKTGNLTVICGSLYLYKDID